MDTRDSGGRAVGGAECFLFAACLGPCLHPTAEGLRASAAMAALAAGAWAWSRRPEWRPRAARAVATVVRQPAGHLVSSTSP